MEMDENDMASIAEEDTIPGEFPGEKTCPKVRLEKPGPGDVFPCMSLVHWKNLDLRHPEIDDVVIPVRVRVRLAGVGTYKVQGLVTLGRRKTGNVYNDVFNNGLVVGSQLPQSYSLDVHALNVGESGLVGAIVELRREIVRKTGLLLECTPDDDSLFARRVEYEIWVREGEETDEIDFGKDLGIKIED